METRLTHIDLFTGIGGFALAASWAGFDTTVFCERDQWCRAVLAKNFPGVPVINDIKEFNGHEYSGHTLLTGGFPCQPFSQAGRLRGTEDPRHLWPDMCRVIKEARPTWIVGENVARITSMVLDQVCADLEAIGYSVETVVIPACAVDAPHRRDRAWILAHTELCGEQERHAERAESPAARQTANAVSCGPVVSDAECAGLEGHEGHGPNVQTAGRFDSAPERPASSPCVWRDESDWCATSGLGRMGHGIPRRVDRFRGLGNAIVPQVAYQIIKSIAQMERQQ